MVLVAIFFVTGVVETIGFGQLGAFTPLYLQEHLGVAAADVPRWTGILGSLAFVIGLPLAPFWGVWADKYSRKLIIARSSAVEALVFLGAGLSHNLFEFALCRAASGFVLGNTGVMLAAQSAATPRRRLGIALGLVGGGNAIGIAVGPLAGGLLVHSTGYPALFVADGILSLISTALIVVFYREDAHRVRSTDSVARMLRKSAADILAVPWVRALFGAYFLLLLANFLVRPFQPLFIAQLYALGAHFGDLPTSVGVVVTFSALAVGVFAPAWGRLGDLAGFYRMLAVAAVGEVLALLIQAAAGNLDQLLVTAFLQGVFQAGFQVLVSSLLAVGIPLQRRTSVLNLTFLPFYVGGLVAPSIGAALYFVGIRNLYRLSGVATMGGLLLILYSARTFPRHAVTGTASDSPT